MIKRLLEKLAPELATYTLKKKSQNNGFHLRTDNKYTFFIQINKPFVSFSQLISQKIKISQISILYFGSQEQNKIDKN